MRPSFLRFKYYLSFLRDWLKCLRVRLKSSLAGVNCRHIFGDSAGSVAELDGCPGRFARCGKPGRLLHAKFSCLLADRAFVVAVGTYSHNLS
jgi:hypothetical protein